MRKSEGKQIKMIKKNNQGMALITVIVAIGFIAALVSIVLTTTLVNFKMKSVNSRGKDTFYSAEQVLDEITIGLQRKVSDALSASYVEVLENYGSYDNDTKKQTIQTRYYEKLWKELELDGTGHAYYDVAKLEDCLKTTTKWHDITDEEGNVTGGYGAIITGVVSDYEGDGTIKKEEKKYGEMMTFSDTGIVLKDIKVYYKDAYGFVSVIQTDIRLAYPNFEFAKSSMLADIADYCFIADDGIEKTVEGKLDISGNAYANDVKLKKNAVTIDEENLVIVKHDLSVEDGSITANKNIVLWAKDIIAKSSVLNIDGSIHVADDLDIQGRNTKVTFSGEYIGYGYNMKDSEKSSAILVNGKGTELDFSKLTDFTIAGHAFLGLTNAKDIYHNLENPNDLRDDTADDSYKNVYTGESIAIKPDQLMYLVPEEAIGVDNMTERKIIINKASGDNNEYAITNPMTKATYTKLMAEIKANKDNPKNDYALVSDAINISALGCTLDNYIRYNGKGVDYYYHEVRVNDDSVGSLVYLYMLFDDEDKANEYASKYYSMNEALAGKYTKSYLKSVKLPKKLVSFGNVYQTVDEDVMSNGLANVMGLNYSEMREKKSDFPEANILYSGNKTLKDKLDGEMDKFNAYTTKLVPNQSELVGCKMDNTNGSDKTNPESQVVFENIASKKEQLLEFINGYVAPAEGANDTGTTVSITGVVNKTMTFTATNGEIAIVSTEDVTVDNDNIKLVITSGDVLVTSSKVDGVILCGGKITFNKDNIICQKNNEAVRRCLQFYYVNGDGDSYSIASCLADGNDYIFANYGKDSDKNNTTLTGLVTYENWKKE